MGDQRQVLSICPLPLRVKKRNINKLRTRDILTDSSNVIIHIVINTDIEICELKLWSLSALLRKL